MESDAIEQQPARPVLASQATTPPGTPDASAESKAHESFEKRPDWPEASPADAASEPTRGLPWRQFTALTWKNWIVLKSHWIVNLLRCLIIPIAYYIFLVYAQTFLSTHNDLGLGTAVPIRSFSDALSLNDKPFYWIDATGGASSSAPFSAQTLIDTLKQQLPEAQQSRVRQIGSAEALAYSCPQTFVGLSPCFGAVEIAGIGRADATVQVNYTLRFDPGLFVVRAPEHSSDVEKYMLPVQLAMDRAIYQLTGQVPLARAEQLLNPLEQPFTHETNAEQAEDRRLSELRGINQLVVLAFLIGFLGVPYHLASDVSSERGSGMSDLLTSLGCSQHARLLSWLAGPAAAYFPAYVAMAGAVAGQLWTRTSPAVPIFGLLLQGAALASFTLFLASFFRRSTLSAIISTAITILLAIVGLLTFTEGNISQSGMIVLGLLFPPMNFVYFFISVGLFEIAERPANLVQRPPADGADGYAAAAPLALLLMSVVSIVLFFYLAVIVERVKFYPESFWRWVRNARGKVDREDPNSPAAVSLRGVTKQYGKKADSLAVSDLSFDVAPGGLTYMLGANGSGKSTTIAMLSGTVAKTSGEILVNGRDRNHVPPGYIGLCPQKNVLFAELTALQHVRLFAQLKGSSMRKRREKIAEAKQMLEDCDLAHKLQARPGALSGGQKRKLSLANALAGVSKLICVDEASSGLDPLSRRAIWKILLAQRHRRTIIATTHFLDEADVLADEVKILAAPGVLLAEGSPVNLRQELGDGISVQAVCTDAASASRIAAECVALHPVAKRSSLVEGAQASQVSLKLPSTEQAAVVDILDLLEREKTAGSVVRYDASGASMESVFLRLNVAHERERGVELGTAEAFADPATADKNEGESDTGLMDGRPRSFLALALVQCLKRWMVLKRSPVGPLLAVIVAIFGSIIPLIFLQNRDASCLRGFAEDTVPTNLTLQQYGQALVSPPELLALAGNALPQANLSFFVGVSEQNFTQTFSPGGPWQDIQIGGILAQGQQPTFAYAADAYGPIVPFALLALVDNVLIRQAGSVAVEIIPQYQPLSFYLGALGDALKWAIIFALVQAVWPAFACLYPSNERRSGAKAMLLTNGQRPLALWTGHLLAELPIILIATVPVALVYGLATSNQFADVGLLWLVLFLHGIAGTCQAFWVSQLTPNPLAAFALLAAWNVVAQLIFIAVVLSVLTFVVTSDLSGLLLEVYYVIAIISPTIALTRASWVSANLFNLLCNGRGGYSTSPMSSLPKFGGPILYAVLWCVVGFVATVMLDEPIPIRLPRLRRRRANPDTEKRAMAQDPAVLAEEERANDASRTEGDILKVQHVTHSYGSNVAVDDVSFAMPAEETFALAGINGAGKSTLHACIRGEIRAQQGKILVGDIDVVRRRTLARAQLSSVPQHDGLDENLTVNEHLRVYALVKGVPWRHVRANVDTAVALSELGDYRTRRAGALSGGNKRKLSLAIALMGNPKLYMLDELSSGVDSLTKRLLWRTLRRIGRGRAILMTSHSMEEVDALADRIAIQAGRFLALGTVEQFRGARPACEVQFSLSSTQQQPQKQRELVRAFMSRHFPLARESDAASMRFEVPLCHEAQRTGTDAEGQLASQPSTVAQVYRRLHAEASGRQAAGIDAYVVQPISLESLFLQIVRDANLDTVA